MEKDLKKKDASQSFFYTALKIEIINLIKDNEGIETIDHNAWLASSQRLFGQEQVISKVVVEE